MCPLPLVTSHVPDADRTAEIPRFVRLYESMRAYICICVYPITSFAAGCPAGQNAVNWAWRLPTETFLHLRPLFPGIHRSRSSTPRGRLTVTLLRRNFFLRLRQCRGLPVERARTLAILLGVVRFLSPSDKSLGHCQRNAVPLARKLESRQSSRILRILRLQRAVILWGHFARRIKPVNRTSYLFYCKFIYTGYYVYYTYQ